MISYVTIRYPTFGIKFDGRDPIYDILGEKEGPHLLYHIWQGGTLYMVSYLTRIDLIFYITVEKEGHYIQYPSWQKKDPIYHNIAEKDASYIRYPRWHEITLFS